MQKKLYIALMVAGGGIVIAYLVTMNLDVLNKHTRLVIMVIGFALLATGQWKLHKLDGAR